DVRGVVGDRVLPGVAGRIGATGPARVEQHELELVAQPGEVAEVQRGETGAAGVTDERGTGAGAVIGERPPVRRRQPFHLPSATRSLPAKSGVIVTSSKPKSDSSRSTRSPVPAAVSSTRQPPGRRSSRAARASFSVAPEAISATCGSQSRTSGCKVGSSSGSTYGGF